MRLYSATQIHLSKLDNNYNPIFTKVYSSPTGHLIIGPTPLSDLTFICPGYITQGSWNNPIDMAIVKLDNNGDTIWCKKYDDGGNVLVANSVIPVNSNSYIISGATDLVDSS